MRIAIAQIATRAGDFDGTARRMAEVSRRAADAGADLLVFPVAALCGVTPVQRTDREGFLIDLMECLLGLIDELACPCLLPVLLDPEHREVLLHLADDLVREDLGVLHQPSGLGDDILQYL